MNEYPFVLCSFIVRANDQRIGKIFREDVDEDCWRLLVDEKSKLSTSPFLQPNLPEKLIQLFSKIINTSTITKFCKERRCERWVAARFFDVAGYN